MSSKHEKVRVLSMIPGRVRLSLPGWTEVGVDQIEERLGRLPGVRGVRANPLTRNVLIHFDPRLTTGDALLGMAGGLRPGPEDTRQWPCPDGSRTGEQKAAPK